MSAAAIIESGEPVPSRPWPRYLLSPDLWSEMVAALAGEPALALLGLWSDGRLAIALFQDQDAAGGGRMLAASCPCVGDAYPALSPARPSAAWFERMVQDLWGRSATGGRDSRPWLDHGRWGVRAPMTARPQAATAAPEPPEFLGAGGGTEGSGLAAGSGDLHQVAVGPIHAGIIEPGHFRFHAQGETVVRLEARLGYTHKGTLALMRGKSPRTAARFAARLSGDATVAHSLAFAQAAEAALETPAPPRAAALRAVMAELERIANHLGDVGAIAGDAAFALLPARCGWHREMLLRAAAAAFGHRLMMDCVVPGGVAGDLATTGAAAIGNALAGLEAELPELARLYDDTSSLADRMVGTGVLRPELAAAFAAGGPVGRASGRAADARRFPGYPPYPWLEFAVPTRSEGDVDARVRIRLAEIGQSLHLLRQLLDALPDGPVLASLPPGNGEGFGCAESFRGAAWHWLRLEGGLIAAGFACDPSWLHWPLLQAAIEGNIIADFPVCNKSFNGAYSGVDL